MEDVSLLVYQSERTSHLDLDFFWIFIIRYHIPKIFHSQELPKRISTTEEAEILTLLCKVHELEIGKVSAKRDYI